MDGMVTAYDLTNGVIVDMDESIYMISPVNSPLITGVGTDGLEVVTSEGGLDQISFSWQDEEILVPRSLIAATVTTGDSYITVTTGDRNKFSTGDILMLVKSTAEEYVRVTGYGTTADTLLVTRGFDSTTATNFAVDDKVRGLGTALPEGSDPERARAKDRDTRSNNTQIFGPTLVHMSRTQRRIRRYGVSDEFSKQTFNRIQEMLIMREQAALYGRRFNSTDDRIRTTGGMLSYITSNVDTTSTQLTVATIQSLQQKGYNRGKVPEILGAHPAALTDLNDITNTNIVRVEMTESRRGRARVTVVVTEYGDVVVARNRYLEPKHAALWSRENAKRRVMDPLQAQALGKSGDSDKLQLVCEEGWEWKGQQHMAKFTALGYTNTE